MISPHFCLSLLSSVNRVPELFQKIYLFLHIGHMTEADLYRLKSFKSLIKLEIELLIVCGPMPRCQKYFFAHFSNVQKSGFRQSSSE